MVHALRDDNSPSLLSVMVWEGTKAMHSANIMKRTLDIIRMHMREQRYYENGWMRFSFFYSQIDKGMREVRKCWIYL